MAQLTQSDILAVELCEEDVVLFGSAATVLQNVADVMKRKGYNVKPDFWSMGWIITKGN